MEKRVNRSEQLNFYNPKRAFSKFPTQWMQTLMLIPGKRYLSKPLAMIKNAWRNYPEQQHTSNYMKYVLIQNSSAQTFGETRTAPRRDIGMTLETRKMEA